MAVSWTENGCVLDTKWLCPGQKMVVSWTGNGCVMDVSWTENGCVLDRKWLCPGQTRLENGCVQDTKMAVCPGQKMAVSWTENGCVTNSVQWYKGDLYKETCQNPLAQAVRDIHKIAHVLSLP